MKKIAVLMCAGLLALFGTANAAVHTITATDEGNHQIASFVTASLATNAIDTLEVNGVDMALLPALIQAAGDTTTLTLWGVVAFVSEGYAGTGGSGSGDSLQVGVDIGFDGQNWVQATALGNLMTGSAPQVAIRYKFSSTSAAGLKAPPTKLRFRYKNTGAATAKFGTTAVWRSK